MRAESDHGIRPGWAYNPATWRQRLPIVVLAIVGVAIAGYLSLYQLGSYPMPGSRSSGRAAGAS